MCKTTKPAACEVPGCDGTYRIAKHKATGLFACSACRLRYRYNNNGTFDYRVPKPKPKICKMCNREVAPSARRHNGICARCQKYYRINGTYKRKINRRTLAEQESTKICQRCNTRKSVSYAGERWLCKRCAWYYYIHGKHRPMHRDADVCRTCACPLERTYSGNHGGKGYCKVCREYIRRYKRERSPELIKAQAPHGWCECGKPATKQIDLRTGALYVHPTKTGTSDVVRAEVQEWAEWVCDECAGFEEEMQHIDGNEYRPGALIARE